MYRIKYLLSTLLLIYISIVFDDYHFVLFGILELVYIYFSSLYLLQKSKIIGQLYNNIILLFFNINCVVRLFGGTYISSIMLSNINSIHDLSGKFYIYIPAIIIVLLISFAPIKKMSYKKCKLLILFVLISYVLIVYMYGIKYSPILNYYTLSKDVIHNISVDIQIKRINLEKNEFLNYNVSDYISYSKFYQGKPNIILIFVEGFSSHIIDDNRDITPNIKQFKEESIYFDNYYNHTAATYRGLIGQLYSGYQFENNDSNKLVSIMSLLRNNGYSSEFINTEPDNKEFTYYLNSLGFDNVKNQYPGDIVHDKEAYEQLYNEASDLNNKKVPFFLSIYTFDTHVGLDSFDITNSDFNNNNVLNRIYNMDYHFGLFLEKFKNSDLYDNTILVLTSDHASYSDYDYIRTFEENNNNKSYSFIDKIPLIIYHKDIVPNVFDASCRNSLDLVPTILDYIDVTDYNYFLGDSLFTNSSLSKFDKYYAEGSIYFSTEQCDVKHFDTENEFEKELIKYYSISRKK